MKKVGITVSGYTEHICEVLNALRESGIPFLHTSTGTYRRGGGMAFPHGSKRTLLEVNKSTLLYHILNLVIRESDAAMAVLLTPHSNRSSFREDPEPFRKHRELRRALNHVKESAKRPWIFPTLLYSDSDTTTES